jgi:hypothetical protein
MRRPRMTDQKGRGIMENLASGKKTLIDALEHLVRRKKIQVGEALKMQVKLI